MTLNNESDTDTDNNHLDPQQRAELQNARSRLNRLSHLLDDAFTVPILNIKIGWDAIIGLIPGIGDAVGAILSLYLVFQGLRMKMPMLTIARMLINIVIELLLGIVPVLGDLFDITWRANRKNYALLDKQLNKRLVIDNTNKPSTVTAPAGSTISPLMQLFLAIVCGAILLFGLMQLKNGELTLPGAGKPFLFSAGN